LRSAPRRRSRRRRGCQTCAYDGAGNLLKSATGQSLPTLVCNALSLSDSVKTIRTYDELNRVVTVDVPDITGVPGNNLAYEYYADGALKSLVNADTDLNTVDPRWDYTYNLRRLPVEEKLTYGGKIRSLVHSYDVNAHELTLTYPSGLVVNTVPNGLGQASRAGTFATGVTYFPNGGMSGFTYGACNGADCIQHTLTQNARQLPLVTLDKGANDVAVIHSTYAYDANGNVASITDGGNNLNRTRDQLTYDGLDRLTHAHGPNVAWLNADTAYDPLDNIRSNTVGARTWTYQYDANNRLASLLKPTATTITHDVRGNVTSNGVDAFAFDAANRLMAVTGKETYVYDGHGRRVAMKRTSDGKTAYPMYSLAGQLVTDEDNRSDTTTDYIYLNGSLVAKRSKPVNGSTWTTRYLHTDALGSPIAETDATAAVQHVENFTPYGEQSDTLAGAAREQGPAYTGHVTDAGTGLSYMQQRYYDPTIGRFLSVDPMAADGTTAWNFGRYNYAANNPLKFKDPDGRIIETLWDAANVAMDVASLAKNVAAGNYAGAALDLGGLIVDGAATVAPGVPGGAGTAIRAARKADSIRSSGRAAKIERHHVVPKADGRAQAARDNMRANGINPKTDRSNLVDIPGDKHDITKRESYIRDTNDRIVAQPDANSIRAECCRIGENLRNSSTHDLDKQYPKKP
jgi:RHS repeat-associated protein